MSNTPHARTGLVVLFALTALRLLFHAFYVPAFEGPDEPFHLGRALSFATERPAVAFRDETLPSNVSSAVAALPCGETVAAAFGCPRFSGHGAFNILESIQTTDAAPRRNYEAHQPPLYYAMAGGVLAIARGAATTVLRQLLVLRLFSFVCTLVALSLIGRTLRARHESLPLIAFAILWLPGFSEALVRGSNDALLFLWAAAIWWALETRKPIALFVVFSAAGPLVKLTAFPVIVAVAVVLWTGKRKRDALLCALASGVVFPVQLLRGWRWGGTYELNEATLLLHESLRTMGVGFARSIYTFVKTIFWLGEWSFFRAPIALVVAWFAMLVAAIVVIRLRPSERRAAHLAGIAFAGAGFVVLAVLNRKLFGTWGGLGGWYFWGWSPWLVFAARDTIELRGRWLAIASAVFVVAANVMWFVKASALYGWSR